MSHVVSVWKFNFTLLQIAAFMSLFIGCQKDDKAFNLTPAQVCLISQYTNRQSSFDQINVITYDDKKRIDVYGENKYRHSGDSVYVYAYVNGKISVLRFTATSSNGKLQSIKKYFDVGGGIHTYTFDYSVADKITVTNNYTNSRDIIKNVTPVVKSEYKIDNSGNVTESNIYIPNASGGWVLDNNSKVTYTYDKSANPVRGFIIPFFSNNYIPNMLHFCANNVVSYTNTTSISTTTKTYNIQYNPSGFPLSATEPGATKSLFEYVYINCPL